jgi:peptidoglycan hydrolase-like protein with peptidoglycan-binding domain
VHRRTTTALIATLAVLTAGCQAKDSATVRAAAPTSNPASALPTTPVTTAPTLTPTATAAPTLSPTASPKPRPPAYDVKAVQTQLTALKYYVGPVDGDRGASFRSAVMAFQKVNGLGVDGSVGTLTLAALKAPRKPVLKGTGGGTRVEVDLTKQVLYVVTDGAVSRILPVSSGSGKHYLTKSGATATALSPVGYYTIERRIVGERKADLGTLYDPQYFYRGWAIHGSNSVPAYPASHGCIRVTRTDAKFLLKAISVGTRVYVYGGSYTFSAGSSAPGTNDPGGDTGTDLKPAATTSPSATPKPTATPRATPTASPTASPRPSLLPTP